MSNERQRAEELYALLTRARQALCEIESAPYSAVNDSESLRHSIKYMQNVARVALGSIGNG